MPSISYSRTKRRSSTKSVSKNFFQPYKVNDEGEGGVAARPAIRSETSTQVRFARATRKYVHISMSCDIDE